MQRFFLRLLLSVFVYCAGSSGAQASHIYGADFFYKYVGDTTYRVYLVVYGDCSGSNFPRLATSTPQVGLLRNNNQIALFDLSLDSSDEVTPVCPAEKNNTTCVDPLKLIPGVTRYVYSADFRLPWPYVSSSWKFIFSGVMGNSTAGRSNSISNLTIFGTTNGSVIEMEALLNNSLPLLNHPIDTNSSPVFTTIPTPFYCVNVAQQYNQGAVDADKDSLVYALVPGLEPGGTVTYNPGYSGTKPLSTAAGGFTFNPATGQMSFTPNMIQRSLVVNQVTEYRHGVVVGTASREMTFVVLGNCNITPASNSIDTSKGSSGTVGGVTTSTSDFNVCIGTDTARFNIIAKNPGNNVIKVSVTGLPPGATATITNDSSTAPIVTFAWKFPPVPPGNYTFYVTYKDNGCPLSSQQTQAYTVHVYRPAEMTTYIVAPTQCVHKALVDYSFAYGQAPRTISISQGGGTVRSFVDTAGHYRDSLGTGTYQVMINSKDLVCPSYYTLTIVDSGIYPNPPRVTSPVFYCKDDLSKTLIVYPDSVGGVVRWYNPAGAFLGTNPPTPRTDTTGIFTWLVDQKFKVCVSPRDTIQVYVTQRPIASFTGPSRICQNDTAALVFTGSIGVGPIIEYHWDFDGAGYAVGDSSGPWRVHWYDTGMKVIRLQVAENKCASNTFLDTVFIKRIPYAGFEASDACQLSPVEVHYTTDPDPRQTYLWSFPEADVPTATGPGPYTLSWADSGVKKLSLTVDLEGCADTRTREINIHPLPTAKILHAPLSVACLGDKITLVADGGVSYYWVSSDSLLFRSDSQFYTFRIMHPATFHLQAANQWGCSDTAAYTITTVEPCCNFSYPNAFTPNGDGRNDRFRVITYGNQVEYELSIYNRWGQRVYYGTNPLEGWDGTFSGKLCDQDTYFYYLNAKCYTGHQETQKGEVMLLR